MISDERKGKRDFEKEAKHRADHRCADNNLEAGRTAAELARETGISKHTIYAWKSQLGGMEVNETEELRSSRDEIND